MIARMLRWARRVLTSGTAFFIWLASMVAILLATVLPSLWLQVHLADWLPTWFAQAVTLVGGLSAVFLGLIPAGMWTDRFLGPDVRAAEGARVLRRSGFTARDHDDGGLAAVVVELGPRVEEVSASRRAVKQRLEALGEGYSVGVDGGAYVARFGARTPPPEIVDAVEMLSRALAELPTAHEVAEVAGQLTLAEDPEAAGRVSVTADAGSVSEV